MPGNLYQDAQAAVNRVLGREEVGIAENPEPMVAQPEALDARVHFERAQVNERNWYAPPPPMPNEMPGAYVGDYIHTTKPSKYIDTMARERYLTLAYKVLAGTADKTIEDVIAAAGQIDAYVNGTNERD